MRFQARTVAQEIFKASMILRVFANNCKGRLALELHVSSPRGARDARPTSQTVQALSLDFLLQAAITIIPLAVPR